MGSRLLTQFPKPRRPQPLLQTHHGDLGACLLAGASLGLCNYQAYPRKTAPMLNPKPCPIQSTYRVWEGEAGAEPKDLAQPSGSILLAWTTAQQVSLARPSPRPVLEMRSPDDSSATPSASFWEKLE